MGMLVMIALIMFVLLAVISAVSLVIDRSTERNDQER